METIRYLRRKNLGNYEHEELEVSAAVDGKDADALMVEMKTFVCGHLGLETPVVGKSEKVEAPKKENATKGETKVTKPKPQEEAPKEEAPKEEAPKKEETPKEEPKKTKKETTTKVRPSKNTVYDRAHDPHKALVGKFLDEEYSGWRKNDLLKKASEASKALNGKDFQDGDGNVLEAFKVEFRKFMDAE
jgi:outer membrane biosynthesis protein TonB